MGGSPHFPHPKAMEKRQVTRNRKVSNKEEYRFLRGEGGKFLSFFSPSKPCPRYPPWIVFKALLEGMKLGLWPVGFSSHFCY